MKTVESTPEPFISSHLDYWGKRSQEREVEEVEDEWEGRSETQAAHAPRSWRLFSQSQSWQFSFRLFCHYMGITISPSEAASSFPPFVRLVGEMWQHTHTYNMTDTRKTFPAAHAVCSRTPVTHADPLTPSIHHTRLSKRKQKKTTPINKTVRSSRCVMPSQNDKLSKLQAGRGNVLGLQAWGWWDGVAARLSC